MLGSFVNPPLVHVLVGNAFLDAKLVYADVHVWLYSYRSLFKLLKVYVTVSISCFFRYNVLVYVYRWFSAGKMAAQ